MYRDRLFWQQPIISSREMEFPPRIIFRRRFFGYSSGVVSNYRNTTRDTFLRIAARYFEHQHIIGLFSPLEIRPYRTRTIDLMTFRNSSKCIVGYFCFYTPYLGTGQSNLEVPFSSGGSSCLAAALIRYLCGPLFRVLWPVPGAVYAIHRLDNTFGNFHRTGSSNSSLENLPSFATRHKLPVYDYQSVLSGNWGSELPMTCSHPDPRSKGGDVKRGGGGTVIGIISSATV